MGGEQTELDRTEQTERSKWRSRMTSANENPNDSGAQVHVHAPSDGPSGAAVYGSIHSGSNLNPARTV